MSFNWRRPSNILYPSVWLKFKAKDLDSDDMVEYVVQDLPEDRFNEAIEIMAKQFLAEAPLAKSKEAVNDTAYVEDTIRLWKITLNQRMTLVCMKEGSNEMVGLITNYVSSKDDANFFGDLIKSEKFLQCFKMYVVLYEHGNFNVFQKYGVDKYLSSLGMYVPKKFGGRKIGEKLLEASKYLGKPCDIHLRHSFFTSNISNHIADNLGYTVDVELSFDEIHNIDPTLIQNIASIDNAIKADIVQSLSLEKSNQQNDFYIGPYLDGNEVTNVTVQIGTNAYLPCKVKQLGNKSVSWVRVRDDHILSVDRTTFIADERFQAYFKDPSREWMLQIKYVQARDAGIYECQVSTEPKVAQKVQLHVVVPRTEVSGDSDRYVKAGSTVVLRCIIRGALEPPSYIIWYHGAMQLLPDNQRGFKMQMGKGTPDLDGNTHSTVGTLVIETTKKNDSGNFTCSPSNSPPSTVTLHVINSESSASAVTSTSACIHGTFENIFALILSIGLWHQHT